MRGARFVLVTASALLLTGCATETLFRSNFDATQAGQPPATAQSIGTAVVAGPPGSVIVIEPPAQPSGKWLQVSRPNGSEVAHFQGKLVRAAGAGTYVFSATLFMPKDAQTATLQFETASGTPTNSTGFLHLDFTPENNVRIDDNEGTRFGTFPRGKPFIVQVTLDIAPTASTARIILSGDGASGDRTHSVLAGLNGRALQFGAVRVFQGFPHVGAFDVTNVSVRLKQT